MAQVSAGQVPNERWRRVIPIAFLMYTIAFMDRINVGVALPAMAKSLHFNPTISGTVFGIFFVGYLVLQMPGGHLAEKWSAKKVRRLSSRCWSCGRSSPSSPASSRTSRSC